MTDQTTLSPEQDLADDILTDLDKLNGGDMCWIKLYPPDRDGDYVLLGNWLKERINQALATARAEGAEEERKLWTDHYEADLQEAHKQGFIKGSISALKESNPL